MSMETNIRRMSDEQLEREIAFAEGFGLDDSIGRGWLEALQQEQQYRTPEAGDMMTADGLGAAPQECEELFEITRPETTTRVRLTRAEAVVACGPGVVFAACRISDVRLMGGGRCQRVFLVG